MSDWIDLLNVSQMVPAVSTASETPETLTSSAGAYMWDRIRFLAIADDGHLIEDTYQITLVDLSPEIPICGAQRGERAICIALPGHESPHVACAEWIEAECHPRVVNIAAIRSRA